MNQGAYRRPERKDSARSEHLLRWPFGGFLGDAWRHCVGSGNMALALHREYQEALALARREIGFRHVRGHGVFTDAVGLLP